MGGIFQGGPEFRPLPEVKVQAQIIGRFFYDKARYQQRPDLVPVAEKHKEVETKLGPVVVTSDYGGPHSKYDDENQDSFVFGNTQNESIFVAVIDGAGGSGGGLEASIKANLDLGINLTNGLSPLDAMYSAHTLLQDINEQKKIQAYAQGMPFNESRNSIYATGVALQVEKSGRVLLASSGDSKIATIRNGAILREGTTQMQNIPSRRIEQSLLDSKEYYCHFAKSTITGGLGIKNGEQPLGQEFFGQDKDRIVLASDGLWDLVSEYEVAWLSNQCKTAAEFQAALFKMAYDRNNADFPYHIEHAPGVLIAMPVYNKGGDNITIAVMELDFSSKAHVYLEFEGNPTADITYMVGDTLIRVEAPTEKVEKNQIKISELNPDGSLLAKYILDKELWDAIAQRGFSRAQKQDFDRIKNLPLPRQSFKDLLDLPSEKSEVPDFSKEKIKVGESYVVRTPGKTRTICFSFHIVDISATEIVFVDFTKPGQEQRQPRSWWNTIVENPKTHIEKLEAPEPKPGDSYRFRGFQKDGTPYDFHLTVQRVEGNTLYCIGKTANVFERPRQFWNALFTSPGAQAIKIS